MQIIINYLNVEREACTLKLNVHCNLDKAKRIADDLYFVCPDVRNIQVMGDSDNELYKTN